jgi:hypothetical protein
MLRSRQIQNTGIRVVHAHDAAKVAENCVRIGKLYREQWYRIPNIDNGNSKIVALFQSGNKVLSMISYTYSVGAELMARFVSWSIGAVLHIHGGHLHRFCNRTKVPFVLHIHGSDIRSFDENGVPVSNVSPGTLAALRKARGVAYSTPELGPILRELVSKPTWIPAPFKIVEISRESRNFDFADVFFPHVWMKDKDLASLFRFIRKLQSSYSRELRLVGIDLGDKKNLALELGFKLVPAVSPREHISRMMTSKIVLGQPHGAAFGVSDLQAIASGSNYLAFPLQAPALEAYGYLKSDQPSRSEQETLNQALKFLDDPETQAEWDLSRIVDKHTDSFVYQQLRSIYETPGLNER